MSIFIAGAAAAEGRAPDGVGRPADIGAEPAGVFRPLADLAAF